MNINFLLKFINKKKYLEQKIKKKLDSDLNFYNRNIKDRIIEITSNIEKKENLNFLHSGHLGDLIYALPLTKEISKTKKCNLFIELNKKNTVYYHNHPSGDVLINKKSFDLLSPLLNSQEYLNSISLFNNQNIDVDLNFLNTI